MEIDRGHEMVVEVGSSNDELKITCKSGIHSLSTVGYFLLFCAPENRKQPTDLVSILSPPTSSSGHFRAPVN